MRSEAFVCRGSLGAEGTQTERQTDSCASASGVTLDRHSAVKNFILAWTRLLDVTLKATRQNRPVCKDCTVMLSHTHSHTTMTLNLFRPTRGPCRGIHLKFQEVRSLYFLSCGGPDNTFWNSCIVCIWAAVHIYIIRDQLDIIINR